jgi:phosphoglucosamine mutase
VVDGDQLMAVIAKSWKDDGRLSKQGVVATIMSNLGLERYLGGIGLTLARTAVGDRYVLEHMREHGFNIGGEQSGHMILSDYSKTWTSSERSLPFIRSAAADFEECSL